MRKSEYLKVPVFTRELPVVESQQTSFKEWASEGKRKERKFKYVSRSRPPLTKSAYDGTHEWVYDYTKPGGTAGV